MPRISDTIARLLADRSSTIAAGGSSTWTSLAPTTPTRLAPLAPVDSNPGAIDGFCYVPRSDGAPPLVVVLHGCTQDASGYDHGSGWSAVAERFGFALLFPQQRGANNAHRCFNWFNPDDTRRDGGEVGSIRGMIAAMVDRHGVDRDRIFVTGLSAGGAMANAMLATYPELFAGGAIIAGLPYGAARSVTQALALMRGDAPPLPGDPAAAILAASPHRGPWPRITVWHGDADPTVDPRNAEAILAQWRAVQGLAPRPDVTDQVDGQPHRVWLAADGRVALEDYRIAGLGHGTPLKTAGADACGQAGAFMLEAGISSTWRQAVSWGLIDPAAAAAKAAPAPDPAVTPPSSPTGVAATIEQALRAAGLRR